MEMDEPGARARRRADEADIAERGTPPKRPPQAAGSDGHQELPGHLEIPQGEKKQLRQLSWREAYRGAEAVCEITREPPLRELLYKPRKELFREPSGKSHFGSRTLGCTRADCPPRFCARCRARLCARCRRVPTIWGNFWDFRTLNAHFKQSLVLVTERF